MGIFKEQIHELEEYQRKSVHIFLDEEGQPEAADVGIWDTPKIRTRIQELIRELPRGNAEDIKRFCGPKGRRAVGRKYTTAVAWEIDGDNCSYTKIEINWYENKYRGKRKPYFEIITNWTHGPFSGYRKLVKE